MPRPEKLPRPEKRGDGEPMLSGKYARAFEVILAQNHAVEQDARGVVVDGQPTAEVLEALAGKRDELGREATVMLVCDLLRDADPRRARYIIELLRRLSEDPGLTLLEKKKVNRALHDGGRRGNPKQLRRFWVKRMRRAPTP